MRRFGLITLVFTFSILCASAQGVADTSGNLIKKGVRQHDRGQYKEAIASYEAALKVNPSSISAIYEMSLSYLKLKDYDNALKYSSRVIEAKFKPLMVDAYIVKGTTLSDMGKRKDAIKLFKEALERSGDEYMLHFNLGLCYFNEGDNKMAIEHLRRAIEVDATNSSAFLLYAYALSDTDKWVQSFYAFHFFLLLEPNTDRSKEAFSEMYSLLSKVYDEGDIHLSPDDNIDRASLYQSIAELRPVGSDPQSQFKFFEDASRTIFHTLNMMQDEKQSSLLWYFFVPTYGEIINSGYFETYCRYVSVAYFNESLDWWSNNEEEVDKFINWFELGHAEEEVLEMDSDSEE